MAIIPGAVGRVDIDVRAWRSVALVVAEADGTVLPLGNMLSASSGDNYMVAYDGLLDFNRLSDDRKLVGALPDGRICEVTGPSIGTSGGLAKAVAIWRPGAT